jgi:hypothetical protein
VTTVASGCRVVHYKDIVPHLPPLAPHGFWHVMTEIWEQVFDVLVTFHVFPKCIHRHVNTDTNMCSVPYFFVFFSLLLSGPRRTKCLIHNLCRRRWRRSALQ